MSGAVSLKGAALSQPDTSDTDCWQLLEVHVELVRLLAIVTLHGMQLCWSCRQ
jgi:hypothetical protein